jgi:hypothetical protein
MFYEATHVGVGYIRVSDKITAVSMVLMCRGREDSPLYKFNFSGLFSLSKGTKKSFGCGPWPGERLASFSYKESVNLAIHSVMPAITA